MGLFVLSGCSGGGKSTLIAALQASGHSTVPEPGARIIAAEQAAGSTALPWINMRAFALRAVAMARTDLHTAQGMTRPVLFDRGLVDAACALETAGGPPLRTTLGAGRAYARDVLLAPPWPEIYVQDAQRQHSFDAAQAEYDRLRRAYAAAGYVTHLLPKAPVATRVAFVADWLAQRSAG